VVDPSVGRDRDLAIRTGNGRLLVGPDNGILYPAWQTLGGVAEAVSVTPAAACYPPRVMERTVITAGDPGGR